MLKDFNESYGHRLRDRTYLSKYLAACLKDRPETLYVGIRKMLGPALVTQGNRRQSG
jgi:hypothetical protein